MSTIASAVHDQEVTGGGKACATGEKFGAVNTFIGKFNTTLTVTDHASRFAKSAYHYWGTVQFHFSLRYDLWSVLHGLNTPVRAQGDRSGSPGLPSFIANRSGVCMNQKCLASKDREASIPECKFEWRCHSPKLTRVASVLK